MVASPTDFDIQPVDPKYAPVAELITVQMALEKYADIPFNLFTDVCKQNSCTFGNCSLYCPCISSPNAVIGYSNIALGPISSYLHSAFAGSYTIKKSEV